MTRDDDYLRDLLIKFEAQEDWKIYIHETHDDGKRMYHALLLCDAGFMERMTDACYRMTNDGHDYLVAIKNNDVWQKTKEGAAKIGGATLGIMKDIAIAYLKQKTSETLGISL